MNSLVTFMFATLCLFSVALLAKDNQFNEITKPAATRLIQALNSQGFDSKLAYVNSQLDESAVQRIGSQRYASYLSSESFFHGQLSLKDVEFIELDGDIIEADAYVYSHNTELDYRIELSIKRNAPHTITRIRLRAVEQQQARPETMDTAAAITEFERYITELAKRNIFSGTVLLAQGEQILMQQAQGLASRRFNASNKISTRFNLGSMNKMFTSVTALKLIALGKLKLDTQVQQVFSQLKDKPVGTIQIQHLLSHSSGIGRFSCEQGETSTVKSLSDCLQTLAEMELNKPSGSGYRYSNEGMLLLGLVIEEVSQLSYDQAIAKYVLTPAGMTSTACLDLLYPVADAAIGYSYSGASQKWKNNLFVHDKKGGPAGGCYSNVGDMFKFAQAMKSHQLLSPAMTDKAWQAKTEFGAQRYGFGFITWRDKGQQVVGHNGQFIGVSSEMRMYLDSGFTIIVLANQSFAAEPIIAKFSQLFL